MVLDDNVCFQMLIDIGWILLDLSKKLLLLTHVVRLIIFLKQIIPVVIVHRYSFSKLFLL